MSLRHRGHQNGRLDGADDVEEDEEAEVTGIADEGPCNLDRNEYHEDP